MQKEESITYLCDSEIMSDFYKFSYLHISIFTHFNIYTLYLHHVGHHYPHR